MKCGLLGRHLRHSYSPQIHSLLGSYSYSLFEKEPQEVEAFLREGDFAGINVTIPYKKAVIPHLDILTDTAKKLGAVNTVVNRGGILIGHNTDYYGFASMVSHCGISVSGKKALVLGSGGASNTVQAVLKELGAAVVVISRSGENTYQNLHLHSDAAFIVNATPVGMYPNTQDSPLSLTLFPRLEGVLDVIYNPARTRLLMDAEKRGLITENGLWMLIAQAKESAQWFSAVTIPDTAISAIHRRMRMQMENIILVGMPGCGKSTVAAALAKKLGKQAVDADAEIEKEAGCSIPEIFSQQGEEAFRALETKVLTRLGKESGLVIATGGGCVTRKENYPLLHCNGTIIWLKRDLEKLPSNGRPLSQSNRLEDLYQARKALYQQFADITADNNGSIEDTLKQICDQL